MQDINATSNRNFALHLEPQHTQAASLE